MSLFLCRTCDELGSFPQREVPPRCKCGAMNWVAARPDGTAKIDPIEHVDALPKSGSVDLPGGGGRVPTHRPEGAVSVPRSPEERQSDPDAEPGEPPTGFGEECPGCQERGEPKFFVQRTVTYVYSCPHCRVSEYAVALESIPDGRDLDVPTELEYWRQKAKSLTHGQEVQ